MVTSLKKWSAAMLVLFMLVGVRNVVQAQNGPSNIIARCVDGSAQDFVDCTQSAPWWYKTMCALRYASDVALCVPAMILPK